MEKDLSIVLKNINLENVTEEDQLQKVLEEDKEFLHAVDYGLDEEVIEEIWDKFQAAIGHALVTRNITAY